MAKEILGLDAGERWEKAYEEVREVKGENGIDLSEEAQEVEGCVMERAKDFCTKLLKQEVGERMTAEEAGKHEFLTIQET